MAGWIYVYEPFGLVRFATDHSLNLVITWRDVKIFNQKPQLVGRGELWPDILKSSFRNSPASSINCGHTKMEGSVSNLHLFHTYRVETVQGLNLPEENFHQQFLI